LIAKMALDSSPLTSAKHPRFNWLPPTLVLTGIAVLAAGAFWVNHVREQAVLVESAYQAASHKTSEYFSLVESRERAIQQADPDQVEHIDQALVQERKELIQSLEGYIAAISDLPQKELARHLSDLETSRIQSSVRSFEGVGRLVEMQISETIGEQASPSDLNQRRVSFWLSGKEPARVDSLNDFAEDPDAHVEQLALIPPSPKSDKFPLLVVTGKRSALDWSTPWVEIFQVQPDHIEKVTSRAFPAPLLDAALGESPTLKPDNSIVLERYVLDPERVMAPCDSCGLLGYHSQFQWKDGQYQMTENTLLNTADNAGYAGLVYLKKRTQSPAWTKQFLTDGFRKQADHFAPFNPQNYEVWEQGFVISDQVPAKNSMIFLVTGVATAKITATYTQQGQWKAQSVQGTFWTPIEPIQPIQPEPVQSSEDAQVPEAA
jgi:hypothetical protein